MFKEGFIETRAQALLDEYTQIISEFFPGVVNLEKFGVIFNRTFTQYQESRKRKMAPESLREGKVSCSSAAALLGIWWETVSGNVPWYFIRQLDLGSGQSHASAHVKVGLHLRQPTDYSSTLVYQNFMERAKSARFNPDVDFFDYTTGSGLDFADVKPRSIPVIALLGNTAYLRHRVRHLSVKSDAVRARETSYTAR